MDHPTVLAVGGPKHRNHAIRLYQVLEWQRNWGPVRTRTFLLEHGLIRYALDPVRDLSPNLRRLVATKAATCAHNGAQPS